MIKKSLKTLGILKFFQFLLAFLCISAPILHTQAFFGFFKKKKKKPAESKKSVNKRAKGKIITKGKKSVNTRANGKIIAKNKKPVKQKKPKHHRDKKSVPGHSKKQDYTNLSKGKLQSESNKNVAKYLKTIDAKSSLTPVLEELYGNSANAMMGVMHLVLPASELYGPPQSDGAIVTVPLKKNPLIESSSKEFVANIIKFLEGHTFNPKTETFIQNLEYANQLTIEEQKIFKEKLKPFIELHKNYHDPKQCKLNFEKSKFSILLDHAKKIESLVSMVKQSNPQDDLQNYKNSILSELNTIETILGYKKTDKKTEIVKVEKTTYERPKGQEDQITDEQRNDLVVNKKPPPLTAPGAA